MEDKLKEILVQIRYAQKKINNIKKSIKDTTSVEYYKELMSIYHVLRETIDIGLGLEMVEINKKIKRN